MTEEHSKRQKLFRMAEFDGPEGERLFVLWTMDEDGVWVFPGAGRSRDDMRRLGETIQAIGSMSDPRMARAIADLTTEEGIDFVELDEESQRVLSEKLVAGMPPRGEG